MVPTAPVAPTTPISGMLAFGARLGQLESIVQRPDRALDVVARNVEGDLDRRRRDEVRLDTEIGERAEGLGRDAGVALHASSYDADLAESFALGPARAEALERARGRVPILLRGGEDDAGSDLDDGVDVHRRVRERLEELGRICALDLEHGLLDVVGDACDHRLLEHPLVLLAYPGALVVRERRAHVQRNAVVARELDAAQL